MEKPNKKILVCNTHPYQCDFLHNYEGKWLCPVCDYQDYEKYKKSDFLEECPFEEALCKGVTKNNNGEYIRNKPTELICPKRGEA